MMLQFFACLHDFVFVILLDVIPVHPSFSYPLSAGFWPAQTPRSKYRVKG
jgi:hypothetical protein